MLYVILFILFLGVAYPVLRYAIYLWSNDRAGTLPEVREQFGGLARPILRGMITAGAADLIVVPTYPLGIFGGREPLRKGTPVLLVHGLFHNSSAWITMKQRLREADIHNVHTYQYNSFWGEFPDAVEGLQRKLDSLIQASPDGKVLLVGHSLGGLVIRSAVGNPRFKGKIAGIVALGTPHGGSDLAAFATNPMGRGLVPGRIIMRLADLAPDPGCPKLAIYTPMDDFVFPLPTLYPPKTDWQETICSPMGHVWMLYSQEVARYVVEFLKDADPECQS